MLLKDKVIVVTGGAEGLGRTTALQCADLLEKSGGGRVGPPGVGGWDFRWFLFSRLRGQQGRGAGNCALREIPTATAKYSHPCRLAGQYGHPHENQGRR